MKKNYPKFSSCFKPVLFLVFFLFLSFNGFGQSISKPIVSDVPVCKGSNLTLTFTVRNPDNGATKRYFTTATEYSVYDYTNGAPLLNGVYTANVQPDGRNASATIVLSIPISNNNNYPAASDYTIRVFSENPNAISAFSDSFIVKPKPPSPTLTNNGPICEGETLELTASKIQGATYNWTGPNGYTATGRTPSRTNVTAAMAGTYAVTANVNGCVSDPVSTNITIDNAPTVNLNAPSTICPGQINISGAFTGTAPWNIQGILNGTQPFNLNINERNFSYPIDIQQNTIIEILNITDGNGCENDAPNESVTINVIKDITNNTISGEQESCGELDAATLAGQNLGDGYNYIWETSTTSKTTGFTAAPGVNNEANYEPGMVSKTTWYRRKVNVQNCTEDISNVVEITINSPISNNNISFFNGNSGTLQATANENQEIALTAPEGTVFTYVDFASYGTPNNNGTYDINEACHASTSQSVTESYLLGENSSAIPATNAVFTDPCVGTFKRLYVSATYAEAFCGGANPGTVQGTAINGSNIEYQWLISSNGATGSFFPASGNNTSQNYEPGTLTQDIWLKRQVISGSCIDESPILYIPVKGVNTWTGTQDTNWNNTNNWSCNTLPTLKTNVLIPENLASGNYPEINAGTNALAKNLTIENNARVLVNENWLRISGDLTNSGVLNTETGSVSFQGTTAQKIPAAAFENNRIQNLRINNTSAVTSEAIIEVTGTLDVENGSFNTGGKKITLISNEVQTALIVGSGNGEVIGQVSMQRYLDRAFGYKYFSTPFQASVVGDFDPYMNFHDPTTGFPHFYRYNENRRAVIDSLDIDLDATGWEEYTDPENGLNIAEGYALNFGTSTTAETIELIGEVNNGVIPTRQLSNHHREYTRGFHLVGNPYPSPIDWEAEPGWTKDNIDDGIYFFTASDSDTSQYTGTYTAYVNDISTADSLVDGRSSNIIPSMQGFFIKVSDSDTGNEVTGSFGMDNRVREIDFDQEFLRSQVVDSKSIIRLEAGFKSAIRKDPMVIYFSSYATPNFEKEMDAHKLMNTDPTVPSFYNLTEDKKELAINAIPFPESRSYKKIPLGIKTEQSGTIKINLASIENLSPNFNIYLIDHKKGIAQNLSNNSEYTFNIKSGTHNSRFELMFSEEEVTSPAIAFNEPFDVEVEDGNVVVTLNLEENQKGILRASTITGQILQIKEASGKDRVIFEGITSDGVYIINLQVGEIRHAKKVLIKK